MTDGERSERRKLYIQARMFDMGHRPDEALFNRMAEIFDRMPTDREIETALADEHAREGVRRSFD
jgi:hypothetical protein